MAELDNREFLKYYKQDSDNEDKQCPNDSKLMRIRGWLIVLLISICLGILLTLFNLLSVTTPLYSWLYFAFLLVYIFVLRTMVKKLYFFPMLYIIFVSLLILYTSLISSQEPTFNYFNIAGFFGAVVWIIYILKSKRVKGTFIYNWEGQVVSQKLSLFNYAAKVIIYTL